MADNVKMRMFILIVLIIISLLLAGGAFYLLQKERAKTLDLQGQLDDLNSKQKMTEMRLEESKKMISTLESKLQDAQAQIDTLTSELQQEKNIKLEALGQIEQLKSELEQQKKLRSNLEKNLSDAQAELKNIQARLKDMEGKKAELEKKIEEFQAKYEGERKTEGVQLGKIVVGPEGAQIQEGPATDMQAQEAAPQTVSGLEQAGALSLGTLEGKVLVVNKDYNFAVINLGSKDGVNIGQVFSVLHNDNFIGDIKIEKVHDSMSAAGFLSADIKDNINEGDKVVLKTK